MSRSFDKLCVALQKREVPLSEYLHFLMLCETADCAKLTRKLKKKNVPLNDFYDYLKTQENTSDAPKVKASTPDSTSPTITAFPAIQRVEQIGIQLLSLAKVDLPTLNRTLQGIPPALLSHKLLLQKLLSEKKIRVQDFVELEQSQWTAIQTSPYQLRFRETAMEFFLKMNPEKLSQIGPYELLEELGRGGMGRVYKAYHPGLNQTVAIKIMLGDEIASETRLKRFHREVQTMAKLQHPGIVQIMASGQEGNKHYFAMEYVKGESLSLWLKKEFSVRARLLLFEQILKALQYAHEQGVIHRDLKPDNILVTQEGEAKIGDFGLAKDVFSESDSQKITQSGIVLGTAHYMSPEQASGETKHVTPQADIYAIGVCLYQVLTQKRPYEANNLSLLIQKILQDDPRPPSFHTPGIHRDLDIILLKSLEKLPEKRYDSAKDFAEDLRRFLEGYPISAKPPHWKDYTVKWFTRHKRWSLVGMILMISLVLAGIVFYQTTLQARKHQIQEFSDQAEKAYQWAQTLKISDFDGKTKKMSFLLQAFQQINQIAVLGESMPLLEQKKWDIGQTLIQFSCETKAYNLAYYVAQELQGLSLFSESTKKQLFQNIQNEKNKLTQHQRRRFEDTLKKLQQKDCSDSFRENAIFEISQMNAEEVFQKLLAILQESLLYFLKKTDRNDTLDSYYRVLMVALGRLESPETAPLLWKALQEMEQKIVALPIQQRNSSDIQFMVTLAEALGNSQHPGFSEKLFQVRWKMGIYGTFWDRTELVYRKLVRLDRADQIVANDAVGYTKRAWAKLSLNHKTEAFFDFKKACELEPQQAEFFFFRAYTQTSLENYEEAIQDLTTAIRLQPNNAMFYSTRGLAKYRKRDLYGCLDDCKYAIQLDPELPFAHGHLGFAQYDLGLIDEAIASFDEGIRLNPQLPNAFNYRGLAKKTKGNFEGALEDFNRAILLNPKFALAYGNRGDIKGIRGDLHGAMDDYNEAIRLNPKIENTYYARGFVKKMLKDFDGAIVDFQTALQLNPNFALAYGNMGEAKHAKKDFVGALQDYTSMIRLNPAISAGYYYRALARRDLNDLEGAIQDLLQTLRIDPRSTQAYNDLGLIQTMLNEFDNAIQSFTLGLQTNSQEYNLFFNRAIAKFKKGETADAKIDFRIYFEAMQNTSDPQIQQARRRVLLLIPDLFD